MKTKILALSFLYYIILAYPISVGDEKKINSVKYLIFQKKKKF